MSFLTYFERFSPASWFDNGLTEADAPARKAKSVPTQKSERAKHKVGGLLLGAVLVAGHAVAGGGFSSGAVEHVAYAPVFASASDALKREIVSVISSHDYAPPGIWASAMRAAAARPAIDESKFVDMDSFF
jgi:hypothetical protein